MELLERSGDSSRTLIELDVGLSGVYNWAARAHCFIVISTLMPRLEKRWYLSSRIVALEIHKLCDDAEYSQSD